MNDALQHLIDSLREELKHYGEMLALLDQQQDHVVLRAADEILQTVGAINVQSGEIRRARDHREHCRRQLARTLGQFLDAPFSDLLPLVPADYQPLLQALLDENNALLVRVQQRARQNHVLLSRSVEMMQRFMTTLFPASRPLVYNGAGSMLATALPSRSIYEGIG